MILSISLDPSIDTCDYGGFWNGKIFRFNDSRLDNRGLVRVDGKVIDPPMKHPMNISATGDLIVDVCNRGLNYLEGR